MDEATQLSEENFKRWQSHPEKYEIVHQLGVPRLREYMKNFDDEEVFVKKDGVPVIMKASGRALRACDCLPYKADLCLDADGNLIDQGQFTERYTRWLESFVYPEGHEVGLSYIPNCLDWLSRVPDSFSESNGPVEIYFDPQLDKEWEPRHNIDPRTGEEYSGDEDAKSDGLTEKLMQALVDKLTPDQVLELVGDEVPTVGEQEVAVEEAPRRSTAYDLQSAPCGKQVKGNVGLKAHMRKCGHEACGGVSENTAGNEAA
jgi:hypothetical protein